MPRFASLAALGVVLSLAACSSSAPGAGGDAGVEPFGAEPKALPLLRCTGPAQPPDSHDGFGFSWDTTDEPRGERWASDDEAVQAVLRGVARKLAMQPGVTLAVARIDPHTTSGVDDPGHTILFEACWRGVPTDRYCMVVVHGRSRYSATTDLGSFEPIPGSTKPVLTRDRAIECAMSWARLRGATEEQLASFRKRLAPRLEFVWAPELNNVGRPEGVDVLSPQWCLMPGDPLYVDAVTGKVWIDD